MFDTSTRDPNIASSRETVLPGDYYLHTIHSGQVLRITDLAGNQAVDSLFFNAKDTAEHYSVANTIRRQRNIYLSQGTLLLSNRNRVLMEIVADTCGRHDTIGGACSTESNTVRYAIEKACMHACRDSWMLAINENSRAGLSKRDITHNINFFMNVPVTPDGRLSFTDGLSGAGKYVELRAHMDVMVLISNCPQLNNPCNAYNPTPVELAIWNS